ncbi:hypothetical protein GKZ89_05555 [Bacillus mangrovi]|uniref:Uncharacterized protein n=1 Tax=Metabacillus mangrovi TaxID=1491830 RepID=A0A7X2S386_9BACI|nr:hypothetical protein [Metabacillus mangrovi]MTH52869.1 hypothetical protein [Metabacillus mangrovi]
MRPAALKVSAGIVVLTDILRISPIYRHFDRYIQIFADISSTWPIYFNFRRYLDEAHELGSVYNPEKQFPPFLSAGSEGTGAIYDHFPQKNLLKQPFFPFPRRFQLLRNGKNFIRL